MTRSIPTDQLHQIIESRLGPVVSLTDVTGGDCHRSVRLLVQQDDRENAYFAKVNSGDGANILESEYQSLGMMRTLMQTTFDELYPQPIAYFREHGLGVLVLQWLDLQRVSGAQGKALAESLVLHHATRQDIYGWPKSNYCGLTLQSNQENANWAEFFVDQRLRPQLALAQQRGLPRQLAEQVGRTCEHAEAILQNHQPDPVLLHGDLWSGNVSFDLQNKRPIFYDPAPYFGDPEVDIAMTTLFGGFPETFYTQWCQLTHRAERELESTEFRQRRKIYNLFHALNHFNLFGSDYGYLIRDHLID